MKSMCFGPWIVMLVVASVSAEPVTVNQLIALKRMGYSDEQVAGEAIKSMSDAEAASGEANRDSGLDLNEDAIRQLEAAGAGDSLISALCNIAEKTKTPDVLEMAEAQQSLEQMVDRIIASCPSPCLRPGVSVDDARLLLARQIHPAAVVALSGKPLGPQRLIMLGEAETPRHIFNKLGDALGFERIEEVPESTKAMVEADVPADIIVALAGMPLGPQQLIMLGEAGTSPQIFNKLGSTLGFEPVKATAESTNAMMEAGVPADIIAGIEKAVAEKEMRDYEIAHEAWTKKVAPYTKLYETLVATEEVGDKFTMELPDMRALTAEYSDSPQTYYVGGGKEDDGEYFVGPLWRIEIIKRRLLYFLPDAADFEMSFAVRNDGSGNVVLYRVEEQGRVSGAPLDGDLRSFAETLGIDLPVDAVRPGSGSLSE